MIVDYTRVKHIYLDFGKNDMRKSIYYLAAFVQNQFDMDVFDDCLLLFCGGGRNKYKALNWYGDGFILLYKLLENGVIQSPHSSSGVRNITLQELRWLSLFSIEKEIVHLPPKKRLEQRGKRAIPVLNASWDGLRRSTHFQILSLEKHLAMPRIRSRT